jgi:hypothetical protein
MTEVLLQPLQHSRGKELSTRSLARALFSFEAFGLSFNPAACRWKKKLDRIILSLEMKSSLSIHAQANQTAAAAAAAAAIFYGSCTFLLG